MKKRIDVELDLDVLSWYSSQATKLNMSRRQYMTRVMERVQDIMGQSPDTPLRYVIPTSLKYPLTPNECIETKSE